MLGAGILVVALATLVYLMRARRPWYLTVVLLALCIGSAGVYTDSFRPRSLWPQTASDQGAAGKVRQRSLVHWHEMLHYYVGAKYFAELGYFGLYDAIVLADGQSKHPAVHSWHIRDMRNSPQEILTATAARRAQSEFRPRFSDERWESFKADIEYMKFIAGADQWMNRALEDSGYNSPPSWTLLGSAVANFFPIAQGLEQGAQAVQPIEKLAWIDVGIMAVACFFLARSFGINALFAFVIAFGASPVVDYTYNAGSLLRFTWLFSLVIAACSLREERYATAGAFMALAVLDRIFPIFFVLGALVSLGLRWIQGIAGARVALRNFCGAGLLVAGIVLPLTVAAYGTESWVQFSEKIVRHSEIRFDEQIGYFRIATASEWAPVQDLNRPGAIERVIERGVHLDATWNAVRGQHAVAIVLVLSAALWCARLLPPYEGFLLLGGLLYFFGTFTVRYYYSYLALIPAVMFRVRATWGTTAVVCAFFLTFIAMWLVRWSGVETVALDFYRSYLCYLFFLSWIGIRLIEGKT